jgi:hypothetical protein
VQPRVCRYYMDLTAQDVRAIVEQHTRLTAEDTAEMLAASAAPPGLALLPASKCQAACALWLGTLTSVFFQHAATAAQESFLMIVLACDCTRVLDRIWWCWQCCCTQHRGLAPEPCCPRAGALPAGSPAPSPAKARSPAAKRCDCVTAPGS